MKLHRVLREVKIPFPNDFFPPCLISTDEEIELQKSAAVKLNNTKYDEFPETRIHPGQHPNTWKRIGERDGLQLYRERATMKGCPTTVICIGTLSSTIEEMMQGLYVSTAAEMKVQLSILHPDYVDAALLHSFEIEYDCRSNDSFSYAWQGLKWMVCEPSSSLLHRRDLSWYEAMGITKDDHGTEVGYLLMQSVQIPECPLFQEQGIRRSSISVCYIFRQLRDGYISVYMKGSHDVGGKAISWSSDAVMVEMWLAIARAPECAQAKQLTRFIRYPNNKVLTSRPTCEICDSKWRYGVHLHCQICGKIVCNRCRLTKKSFLLNDLHINNATQVACCKPCLEEVKQNLMINSARSNKNQNITSHQIDKVSVGEKVHTLINCHSISHPAIANSFAIHSDSRPINGDPSVENPTHTSNTSKGNSSEESQRKNNKWEGQNNDSKSLLGQEQCVGDAQQIQCNQFSLPRHTNSSKIQKKSDIILNNAQTVLHKPKIDVEVNNEQDRIKSGEYLLNSHNVNLENDGSKNKIDMHQSMPHHGSSTLNTYISFNANLDDSSNKGNCGQNSSFFSEIPHRRSSYDDVFESENDIDEYIDFPRRSSFDSLRTFQYDPWNSKILPLQPISNLSQDNHEISDSFVPQYSSQYKRGNTLLDQLIHCNLTAEATSNFLHKCASKHL